MPTVIGLDPSLSSTGVIVLNERGELVHRTSIGSRACQSDVRSRMQRYSELLTRVMNIVHQARPFVACIEGYAMRSQTGKALDRVEYGGLLRWSLVAAGVRVVEVAPSTLKKWATGKGRFETGAGKTPMIVAMTQRYGVSLGTDDEYDAYALGRMAMQIAKFETPANQSQSEAVNVALNGAVKKPKKSRKAGP